MPLINDERRSTLASKLESAICHAQDRVIAYSVITKLNKWIHLGKSNLSDMLATLLISTTTWLFTWVTNRIVGTPITDEEAYILLIPALLTGLAIWIMKVISEAILLHNAKVIAEFPADEECFKCFTEDFYRIFQLRKQLVFSVSFCLLGLVTIVILSSNFSYLIENIGFYIGMLISSSTIGFGAYFALMFPKVVSTLANHHVMLYQYNPAQSGIVRSGKRIVTQVTLGTGIAAMAIMIVLLIASPWENQITFWIAFAWLVFSWGLTTYTFLFPFLLMSSAIVKVKQYQLDRLSKIIDKYDVRLEQLGMEEWGKLKQMIELRENVFKSSDSAFEFPSISKYITSLVLPTFSFIIGSWDKIERLLITR